MPSTPKISVRLTPELQALLSDHVRQGRRVSDILRAALELYLGVQPLPAVPAQAMGLEVSDRLSDLSDSLTALASDVSDSRTRLERLEAGTPPPSGVGQAQLAGPTARPTPQEQAGASAPRRPGRPSSPLRQQILALLQAHPEGLRAEELRVYLQTRRPIGDTLQGMLKGGVISAQGRGGQRRYVVAE
jgi:Arc/MetJ-type ribon-helix-helix transcriptional regulator